MIHAVTQGSAEASKAVVTLQLSVTNDCSLFVDATAASDNVWGSLMPQKAVTIQTQMWREQTAPARRQPVTNPTQRAGQQIHTLLVFKLQNHGLFAFDTLSAHYSCLYKVTPGSTLLYKTN